MYFIWNFYKILFADLFESTLLPFVGQICILFTKSDILEDQEFMIF